MSPMSLLTLPVDTHRDASQLEHHVRPQGESRERDFVLSVLVVMAAAALALVLAG